MLKIIEVDLERVNKSFKAYLGISKQTFGILDKLKNQYLSSSETTVFQNHEYERKKFDFLQGRYVAKQTLSKYLKEENLTKLNIKSGVFNQPLLSYPTVRPAMLSISHTNNVSACIVSSVEHPMALDLEYVKSNNKEAIESQITDHEKNLLKSTEENENISYTRLWTIKEALSKVLTTGMMTPFEVYQIETQECNKEFTISTFTNFSQYKALSFMWKSYVCSIVLPLETTLKFKEAFYNYTPDELSILA